MLLGREGEYLTFKQVNQLGGKVKEGAKSQMVVFFKLFPYKDFRKVKDEDGTERMEEVEKKIPILRYYNVFHIDDCEGIEPKHKVRQNLLKPVDEADQYARRDAVCFLQQARDTAFQQRNRRRIQRRGGGAVLY